MKKILSLAMVIMTFITTKAQDPFNRLKQVAERNPVLKQEMGKVAISETDNRIKHTRRRPIPFRRIEMVDKNRRKIDPNETIVVNGKNQNAKVFFDRLNEIEKEQNAKGYSIRDAKRTMVINVNTPASALSGRVREMSISRGNLKSENELKKLTVTTRQVGGLTLKPFEKYSDAEKKKLMGTKFSVNRAGVLIASENKSGKKGRRPIVGITDKTKIVVNGHVEPVNTTTPLKVINDLSTKDWSFGIMSTFRAGVKADLLRTAKIYSFDPNSPGKSMSEFRVSANAKVYGGLFDNNLDFLSGGVEFYAPADSSKDMTVKGQVRIAGITVLGLNESIKQSKTYTKTTGRTIDKSFSFTVPICCGVGFIGKIGVKGSAGINYSGSIYRTIVSLEAEPVIDLKGYVEAGVSVAELVHLGVGGELTFIHGHIPMNSFVGIWAQNASQIVIGYNYYLGYNLSLLNGRLYGFADICAPLVGCYRLGEVDFFTRDGFKGSGTFTEGGNTYVLANL